MRNLFLRSALAIVFTVSGISMSSAESQDATATYSVDLDIQWTAVRTPVEYPDSAHMSGLIGLTHTARFDLFRDGDTASSGLELVAENGRATILLAQFEELRRRERIGAVIQAPGLKAAPGTISTRFTTTREHPLLSLVTMLAPSPDWFTGIAAVNLRVDEAWRQSIILPLWVWDAGTDSGDTYTAPNADTQPRQSVRLLSTPHFLSRHALMTIGTITIKRIQP